MSDWRVGQLGDLATGTRGVSYYPDQLREFKSSDTVTLLRSNNIQSGRLSFNDTQIVPRTIVSDAQTMRVGDIAVCMSNGSKALVGKAAPLVADIGESLTVGAFCSIFRPAAGADPEFVKHLFQSADYRKQLDFSLAGSAINNLRNSELQSFRILVPPAREQREVAVVLDTLDTTIHQTGAIIEKLMQVRRGVLNDLLTRGVDVNGELRPLPTQAPHLYKESPLGWIPREWRAVALSELSNIRSGTTPARSAASRYFVGGSIPWVKTLDLNEGVIRSTDEHITEAALQECSCEQLPVGTVLIAMYGGWEQIGRTAMLGVPAATNQAISALVFGAAELEPEFVLRAVQHGRPRWASVAASTRKDPNITKSDVASFQIPLPSDRREQVRIVEIVGAVLSRIEKEQQTLSKLQCQKAGLMDDLLTGRVRVTPLLA